MWLLETEFNAVGKYPFLCGINREIKAMAGDEPYIHQTISCTKLKVSCPCGFLETELNETGKYTFSVKSTMKPMANMHHRFLRCICGGSLKSLVHVVI